VTPPVDEEGGRPVHAAADTAHEVFTDALGVCAPRQLDLEPIEIQRKLGGIRNVVFVLQRILSLVQHVVHLPEPALCGCRLRGLGRVLGVWMNLRQREVPEHQPHLIAEFRRQFL
jgi:hypothetical protein